MRTLLLILASALAFGQCSESDTFTGTNGTSIQAHNANWTVPQGSFQIQSNAIKPNTAATHSLARWGNCYWNDDQVSNVVLGTATVNSYIGPAVRVQPSGASGYALEWDGNNAYILKFASGTVSILASIGYGSTFAGSTLTLDVTGTTLTAKRDGSTFGLSATDSTYTSGNPGIAGYDNGSTFAVSWSATSAASTSPPYCAINDPGVLRAGQTTNLTTSSFSYKTPSTLTYAWTETTSLIGTTQSAIWSGASTATPSVTGLVGDIWGARPFNLHLVVTDVDMDSTACDFHAGVVTQDSIGRVVTGDDTFDSAIGRILAANENPWTFMNDVRDRELTLQTTNYDDYYTPLYWENALAGTVSFSVGSATVTGSGTNFIDAAGYCRNISPDVTGISNANPGVITLTSHPLTTGSTLLVYIAGGTGGAWTGINGSHTLTYVSSTQVSIDVDTSGFGSFAGQSLTLMSYPASSFIGYYTLAEGGTGHRQVNITRCESDTTMVLAAVWGGTGVASGTNVSHALYTDACCGTFPFGGSPFWFYENPRSLLVDFVGSGIDYYMSNFRVFTDAVTASPSFENGRACDINNPGFCPQNYLQFFDSLYFRARDCDLHDTCAVDPWPGLRLYTAAKRYFLNTYNQAQGAIWDLRSESLQQIMVAMDALFDPDSSERASSRTALEYSLNNYWQDFRSADNSYLTAPFEQVRASWSSPGGSVSLTVGSPTVTKNGGTAWPANVCNDGSAQYVVFFNGGAPGTYPPFPFDQWDEAGSWYTCTRDSDSQLTLNRNYDGAFTTGSGYGYSISTSGTSGGTGPASQPFMVGLHTTAMWTSRASLKDTAPTEAAIALDIMEDDVQWLRDVGYDSATKGLYYFAGAGPLCGTTPHAVPPCQGGFSDSQARSMWMEALRGVSESYRLNPRPDLKTFADAVSDAMWCAAGFTANCNSDGSWISGFDPGGSYMAIAPFGSKWNGQRSYSAYSWPAARLESPISLGSTLRGGALRGGVLR